MVNPLAGGGGREKKPEQGSSGAPRSGKQGNIARPTVPGVLTSKAKKIAGKAVPVPKSGPTKMISKGVKSAVSGGKKLATAEGRSELGRDAIRKGGRIAKNAGKAVVKGGWKASKHLIKKAIASCVASVVCLVIALIFIVLAGIFTVISSALLISGEDNSSGSSSPLSYGGSSSGTLGYVEEFGRNAGEAAFNNPKAIILEHWNLHSREASDPVTILEKWLTATNHPDASQYRLHTGATPSEACEFLWEDYENPNSDAPPVEEMSEVRENDQPTLCERIWAAATAWDHTLKLLGYENGLQDADTEATYPVKWAIQRKGTIYPWDEEETEETASKGGEIAETQIAGITLWDFFATEEDNDSEDSDRYVQPIPDSEIPGVMAVNLWRSSGFAHECEPDDCLEGSDGFAIAYFDISDTHTSPYCGLEAYKINDDINEDYDDKVLVPTLCPEPPDTDICGLPTLNTPFSSFESGVPKTVPGEESSHDEASGDGYADDEIPEVPTDPEDEDYIPLVQHCELIPRSNRARQTI